MNGICNYVEGFVLDSMKDSTFKNERLHALQVFEVQKLSNDLSAAEHLVEVLEKQEDVAALEAARADVTAQTAVLDKAIEKENTLFRQTEGCNYFEAWQEKLVELKNCEYDKRIGVTTIEKLRQQEKEAREKSYFYNTDSTNMIVQQTKDNIDALYKKHEANFIDTTNFAGEVGTIVRATFDCFTDRNQMAQYAANQIIRFKYPLYPDVGDAGAIEVERTLLVNDISTYKLSGFERDPATAKDRLYKYALAKITNTQMPKHVHRWEKILKPVINEIVGNQLVGYRIEILKVVERNRVMLVCRLAMWLELERSCILPSLIRQ